MNFTLKDIYNQIKKDSMDQESIQSSNTPAPGYQMGKYPYKKKILLQAYSKVAARLLRRNPSSQNFEKVRRSSPLVVMFLRPLPKYCHRQQKIYNVLQPAGYFATGSPEKHQNAIKRHGLAKRSIFLVSIVTIWY